MFSLEDAYTNITLDDIYSKVSEYELWKYYCQNFESFDKSFTSEFYNDSNPDCRVFLANNNKLMYKDFGSGEVYSIINYIMRKYSCTFKECLTIIVNDFKLSNKKIVVDKHTKLLNFEESYKPSKVKIDIISQAFNLVDYEYWNSYKLPLNLVQSYDIYSCKFVHLLKGDKLTTYTSTKYNPIYAYRFVSDNKYVYKIYFPLAAKKYKWLFNGKSTDIEGFDQLSLNGDLLILTKSLKDCMVYRLLGYDAISLQGENNKLEKELYNKLIKRFPKIVINYDNDDTGIAATEKLSTQYNLDYFYIDDFKDISDYIKNNSIEKTKEMLKLKLNNNEWKA